MDDASAAAQRQALPRPRGIPARRARLGLLPVAGMLAWQLVTPASAQASGGAGRLDATFGVGGTVVTDIAGQSDQADAVAVQADGKIVAAGGADESNDSALDDFALTRYQAGGRLDPRFGTHGKVKLDFTGAGGDDHVKALAVQGDGKLVAAGFAAGQWALARFTARGTLDQSFGVAGKVTGTTGQIWAVAVQPDGRILAAGVAGSAFAVARFNPDGSPDLSFGGTGMVLTAFPGLFAEAHAVAVQADGKIVAAGSAAAAAFALARYNPDGTLDPAFGTGGTVTTAFNNGFFTEANGLVLQRDGTIVAAGGVLHFNFSSAFALARYTADGTLDPGFGTGGTVTTDIAGTGTATALVAQPYGMLVAAGTADPGTGSGYDFTLLRYRHDGSLDPRFGTAGRVTTDFGGGSDVARALAVQANGRLLVAGSPSDNGFGSDFALARYLTR